MGFRMSIVRSKNDIFPHFLYYLFFRYNVIVDFVMTRLSCTTCRLELSVLNIDKDDSHSELHWFHKQNRAYFFACLCITVETLYSTIYYSKYFIELNMISLHNKLPFELTKDTPYLALSGELWSVYYEYFNRNWSCYKGFLLYMSSRGYPLHRKRDFIWYLFFLFQHYTVWPLSILVTKFLPCFLWKKNARTKAKPNEYVSIVLDCKWYLIRSNVINKSQSLYLAHKFSCW